MMSAASEAIGLQLSDAELVAGAAPDSWDELAAHNRHALHAMVATIAAEICRDLQSAANESLKSLMAAVRVDDMKYADLSSADLRGEDLSGIEFTGANLTKADLRGCNLRKCNFTWAILDEVQWEGANLEYAIFDGDKVEAVWRAASPPVASRKGSVIGRLARAAADFRKRNAAKAAVKLPDPVSKEPAAAAQPATTKVQVKVREKVRVATRQP